MRGEFLQSPQSAHIARPKHSIQTPDHDLNLLENHNSPTAVATNASTAKTNDQCVHSHLSHRDSKRRRVDVPHEVQDKIRKSTSAPRLVEHDEQTTYVEAPLWYSLSEAKVQDSEPTAIPQAHDRFGYCNTLIDPECADEGTLYLRHPTSDQILELWDRYLTHVHPMTKLFFDWQKKSILQRAASKPRSLSKAEEAFTFAVYFITILSLSDAECEEVMGNTQKRVLLNDFQSIIEIALRATRFAATSDLLVLQAFLLYWLAMRNRASPGTLFSMMGIAVRIAQRIGLHRDGTFLGLSAEEAEEKRRVWWCIQHFEIMVSIMMGCISLTLYGDWDTKMPANIDDKDLQPGMDLVPPDHSGLSEMSACLWVYHVVHMQRLQRQSNVAVEDLEWFTSQATANSDKNALIDHVADTLNERFVKHCELLKPLHINVQISIRCFILAMKRIMFQPNVSNTKISQMPQDQREAFLKNSIEVLEYYILSETTESIAQFRWNNENYFQWPSFVHVIIEARHRAATPSVSHLWTVINKVCTLHPKLCTAPERPDIIAIGRLVILAWHQREKHLHYQSQTVEKPWCVAKMEDELAKLTRREGVIDRSLQFEMDDALDLDFDLIDWAAWENDGYNKILP
ncbi:hypothetical protein N7456_007496 [Penicillium angulare]|uniref:Xylanolytic transcriptional activator regulatory domain-containing protein n=1 Tax=Penicillium angulare TaxID=116970 RepID=A0A9W9FB09_9EURO|nr:hypothetical protein N7456_007496 [Penicillium angulare]